VDHYHLTVEERALDRDVDCAGDDRKAVGPVVTVAGVDLGTLVQVDLQPVAIILDFV
jgi:hypothetical protein